MYSLCTTHHAPRTTFRFLPSNPHRSPPLPSSPPPLRSATCSHLFRPFKGFDLLALSMADASAAPLSPESAYSGDHAGGGGAREQDRFLPIANIGRIMRKAVPENGKIAKDAKESVQECVSEFISFITSEASDKCAREKRKTINGDDLLWAMATLGFEDYVEPLKLYLRLYREAEGDGKGSRSADQSGKRDTLANVEPTATYGGM